MVQIDTWVSRLKHADDLAHLSSGFISGLGNVVWKGWEPIDPFNYQPDDSAELWRQQDQGRVMGRFADCFFICSFSSLRNLQRSVRLWRKEVWNGTAEGPRTKGRTHHPRHLLLRVAPACLSVRLTPLTISGSQGHLAAGPRQSSPLSCVL